MKLANILKDTTPIEVHGSQDVEVSSLAFDSRKASAGQLFFAIPGTQVNGHQFIPNAIEAGVSAVVCEQLPPTLNSNVCYVKVANATNALGIAASAFYNHPSSKLTLVGITGTNGKTTTATLLYHLFKQAGYKAGLLSTVVNYVDNRSAEATHTTPDPIEINSLLAEMVDVGCGYCFMEVSSHAVVQERITGLTFAGGIFSNITHDHLDYHKTFEAYIKAKKSFFDQLPANTFALINADDRNGRVMVQNTRAKVKTYALRSMADYKCRIVEHSFDGMLLNIDGVEVWTNFIGEFNAYNLLAVYATAIQLGVEKEETLRLLSLLKPVAGRFEYLRSTTGITAVVDYAHTPDALSNVLSTINKIRQGNERIITVVGCGGNRDKTKRPIMAQVAVDNSDIAILTSDNPRFENPDDILNDMKEGLSAQQKTKALFITGRLDAIRTAILMAKPHDIVLVAGKGHETYQDVSGVKHHFDDKEVLQKIFSGE